MKKFYLIPSVFFLLISCSQSDESLENDIRQAVYPLYDTVGNAAGEVVISDLGTEKVLITVSLADTQESNAHPVHLHFGSISEKGNLAFQLNPMDGVTGVSETLLENQVLDGWAVDYELLVQLDGSIKVHMDDDTNKNQVLVYGNVGINSTLVSTGITTCTGH